MRAVILTSANIDTGTVETFILSQFTEANSAVQVLLMLAVTRSRT